MAPMTQKEFLILDMNLVRDKRRYHLSVHKEWRTTSANIVPKERRWLDRIMAYERMLVEEHIKLHYALWKLTTSEETLFWVQGNTYDKLVLVLGDDTVYWAFSQKTPPNKRIEGSSVLPFTYCPCCKPNISTMETVKDYLRANNN